MWGSKIIVAFGGGGGASMIGVPIRIVGEIPHHYGTGVIQDCWRSSEGSSIMGAFVGSRVSVRGSRIIMGTGGSSINSGAGGKPGLLWGLLKRLIRLSTVHCLELLNTCALLSHP